MSGLQSTGRLPLTAFSVVREVTDDDTLIHCFDGRDLVLVRVTREALDDYFGWPWSQADEKSPSATERQLVVDRNLPTLEPIIQGKYGRGEYELFQKSNSTLKLVVISGNDIPKGRVLLTDSVIAMARRSRFG